ncbi:LamB/YcsF family protein [Antrihabitans sp. YC3-6]|uniref:5-oxoprolinase subunit A n=1 Tax=Antrihabitans stalagmiti TaxID=2799499 RepID=A0A934NVD0_9NOCA|nr:LamB/YcsF family protein [Antrihabitans stalagmiti]
MQMVDLNADVGEGYGRWECGPDADVLTIVTSANIACGFHAGDPSTLRATTAIAATNHVAIGAHVGYPDLLGFGRRFMDLSPAELTDAVVFQIGALDGFSRIAGERIRYVKPHGALYNAVVDNTGQADALVAAVSEYDPTLTILGMGGSALFNAAERAGLATATEAFPDRGYTPDGRLASRKLPGAVIGDPAIVARRALRMVLDHEVEAIDGTIVTLHADSLCIHGDSPTAAIAAQQLRSALTEAGVTIEAFTA